MNRSKSVATALASVVLGGAALALAGFALASNTPHQKALECVTDATQANTCNLNFSVFPDSLAGEHGATGGAHPDWVSYSNQDLGVPANTTVNVTIKQYDSGGALNNYFFDQVMGTVGGTATVNGVTVSHVVYEWNCEFPCGGSREGQFGQAMSSYGYMSGTLTVK